MGPLDRRLAAFGRHVNYSDALYWVYALLVLAVATALALVTGLWGLAGIVLALASFFAIFCRKRYETTTAGS